MYAVCIIISLAFGFMLAWLFRGRVDRRAVSRNDTTGQSGGQGDSAASQSVGRAESAAEAVSASNTEAAAIVKKMADLLDSVRRGNGGEPADMAAE